MFDRIQHLFTRFVGAPADFVPARSRSESPLPANLQRPACWRRDKRIG